MVQKEKKEILKSLYFPALLLVLMWLVKAAEIVFDIELNILGVYPLKWEGLVGILCSPFVHADFGHLMANSVSFFILCSCLFYFYRRIAYSSFFLIYFLSGFWLWFVGRASYHIGASGIIYGLASFLFISGLIRRNPPLMAITLVITFLYGSMIWGIFPEFFPEKNISWEGHLTGLVAGAVLAVYYRKSGPQPKEYEWDNEDEEDDENAYWNQKKTDN